jgi:hypothetical protein
MLKPYYPLIVLLLMALCTGGSAAAQSLGAEGEYYDYDFDLPYGETPAYGEGAMSVHVEAGLIPTSLQSAPVYDRNGKHCEYFPDHAETLCTTTWTGECLVGRPPSQQTCRNVRAVVTKCAQCGEDQWPPPGELPLDPSYIPTEEEIQRDFDLARNYEMIGLLNEAL